MLILGFLIAAVSAYFTVVFFIKLLDTIGLMPFVVYRLILGVVLLIL
jgi:undecaprenyl-diphosphatase